MSLCRLCSGSEQLTDLFHPLLNNGEQLRFYFLLATGLEIREDDIVSKMVCHRCCEIAVKLHKYRANAVSNDKLLKEQCGQTYTAPVTDHDELRRLSTQILTSSGKVLATPYGLPSDGRLLLVDPKNANTHEALELLNISIKSEPFENIPRQKPEPYKHHSVKDLSKKYPGIVLPESVYKCDVSPVVTLDENEVEEWAEEEFKRVQQKLSWAKIIIQKVGESSTSDVTNSSPQTNSPIETKRPGPKSKTLPAPIINGTSPPMQVVKSRPGPKSKTVQLIPKPIPIDSKEKIFESIGVVHRKPLPQMIKPEIAIAKPVLYRPGPKSRKHDLIVNAPATKSIPSHSVKVAVGAVPKPTIESQSSKIAEPPPKLMKIPVRPNNKDNSSIKHVPVPSTSTVSNTVAPNLESDDDFDPGDGYMDDVDDSYSSDEPMRPETPVTRSIKKQEVRASKGRSLRSTKDTLVTPITSITQIENSDDLFRTRRKRKSEKNDSKDETLSFRRASSIESGKSDESAKRRRTSSKNKDERVELKSKIKESSNNKSELKTPKPDVKISSNKDELSSKKNKIEIVKSDKNESPKLVTSIKTDSSGSTNVRPGPKLNSNDKKVLASTTIPHKIKFKSHSTPQKIKEHSTPQKIKDSIPQKTKEQPPKTKVDPPSLLVGRMTKIYMCHTCCKLFDTNKELSEHQKLHLICQYCNYRMKNLETLKKHQIENCRMRVNRQEPTLKLTKVDEIKSIVNKYPEAFDNDTESAGNTSSVAAAPTNNTKIPLPPYDKPAVPILTVPQIKNEIVCLSDESEDDIQCLDPSNELNLLPNSFIDLPLSGMTENNMIQSLFTKYLKAGILKIRRATQTFLPRATDVKYTHSNLIVLDKLFDELYTYKIPVELEIRPKISARFVSPVVPLPKPKIESWGRIKPVVIHKACSKPVTLAPKLVWIAPAKLQTTPSSILAPGGSNKTLQAALELPKKIESLSTVLPTKQPVVVSNPSTTTNLEMSKFQSVSPKTQNNPSLSLANAIVLDNLLCSSPPVPSSNLFITANNSYLPSVNGIDRKPPSLVSLLSNSSASTSNMTTTLIQTSNSGTLFMQNGISPNSTTIIQTPNNATLIQTPNASVIQTGNSTAFTIPDSTSQNNLLPSKMSVSTPVSTPNSVVLMQTVPQVTNQPIINNQRSVTNSNNLLFQSSSEQIYQINNAGAGVNKVVVFSNTLSNGLQQNTPLYAAPYLNNFAPNYGLSTVSIEEIEDNTQNNSSGNNQNKSTLRIKPSWELY